MTGIGWFIVDAFSKLLEPDEREAVVGDLVEAGGSNCAALFDLCGLVFRRQLMLWRNWQPWLAAFGIAIPSTLFLMGFSVLVSRNYQHTFDKLGHMTNVSVIGTEVSLLLCYGFLLIGWSWINGFMVGRISRRTLWISVALASLPCLFCLARFRIPSLSRLSLLLFLLPAICGLLQSLRTTHLKLKSSLFIAATITLLTILTSNGNSSYLITLFMCWPAWYLVAGSIRLSPGIRT
ncbi:MAG TPA: hypothetical protein VEF04_01835 [Blastocatellia bacterium]|nr:hypothetical protein [Blastocatellia bacterium]